MRATIAALIAAAAFAGCGELVTLEQACRDHGGVKPNSIEKENDGGQEARCNDNEEVEQSGPGTDWIVDE